MTIYGSDASDHQGKSYKPTGSISFGKLYDPATEPWTRDIYLPRVTKQPVAGIYVTMGTSEPPPRTGADKWKWAKDTCASLGVPTDGTVPMFDDMLEFGAIPDEVTKFISAAENDGQPMGHYASESGYADHGATWRYVAHFGIYPARPVVKWDLFQYGSAGASGDACLAEMTVDEFLALTTTGGTMDQATFDKMFKQSLNNVMRFSDAGTAADALNYGQGIKQASEGKAQPADTARAEGWADYQKFLGNAPTGDVPATIHFGP